MNTAMTFEEFQAARVHVESMARALDVDVIDEDLDKPGYVYPHGLVIEDVGDGMVMLVIANYSDMKPVAELEVFERKLYQWMLDEILA